MADKQTVIGPETQITGEIRGDGGLEVRGRIEGKIQVADTLVVSNGAIVQADVEARSVEISGVLVGAINAGETVRLLDKARVVGDINAPRVGIAAGAQYRGHVEMGDVDISKRKGRSTARGKAPPRMMSAGAAAKGGVKRSTPRVASVPARRGKGASPKWARKKAKRR